MPVPVTIFLIAFTLAMVALPVMALRAPRDRALDETALTLSWIPLIAWVIPHLMVLIGGQTPPARTTSALIALVLLFGMAAAIVVARTKGAPKALPKVAWACSAGLLMRAAFNAVAAIHFLPY